MEQYNNYKIGNIELSICSRERVLDPSPFSLFLADYLASDCTTQGEIAIDLGCGSGIQGIILNQRGYSTFFVDKDEDALLSTSHNLSINAVTGNYGLVQSDLLTAFQNRKVDLIVANPPTLPTTPSTPSHSDGGRDGLDIVTQIIIQSYKILKRNGRLIFLLSSLSNINKCLSLLKSNDYLIVNQMVKLIEFRPNYFKIFDIEQLTADQYQMSDHKYFESVHLFDCRCTVQKQG